MESGKPPNRMEKTESFPSLSSGSQFTDGEPDPLTSVRLMKIRQDTVESNLFYVHVIWDLDDHRRSGADIGFFIAVAW